MSNKSKKNKIQINNKQKIMTLSSDEFIRRFITHILPPSFVKIRHYGLNSNRNINTKIKRIANKSFDLNEDLNTILFVLFILSIEGTPVHK